jgi:hypothetical protein
MAELLRLDRYETAVKSKQPIFNPKRRQALLGTSHAQ